jgi:uncharacterized protein YheU (UPF0270 family)
MNSDAKPDDQDLDIDDIGLEPIDVPYGSLREELLFSILESFVLREGTDYGERELTLEQKVNRLHQQYKRGEVKLIFDPHSESVTFIPKGQ